MTTYFPTVAHEEGWCGQVLRQVFGDLHFIKNLQSQMDLCRKDEERLSEQLKRDDEVGEAHRMDRALRIVSEAALERLRARIPEINRTLGIREGAMEDVVRAAVERLDATEAMRADRNKKLKDAAEGRSAPALLEAARNLDDSPTPFGHPTPDFLRQPQV